MQKAFNIFVVIALIALGILLLMLWRAVSRLEAAVTKLATIPAPAPANPQRTSISGGELFDELQKSAENMTIQMQFK